MPSGGARSRSGPPPDPNALRRERDAGDWIELPHEGRPGDAPEWPLGDASEAGDELANLHGAELKYWAELWSMPQALVWQRQRQELDVAMYVRRFVIAAVPGSPVALGTLVRQMADSLGLTTPGLRANRWKILPPAEAETKGPKKGTTGRPSARDRLKVLPGGGG